MLLPVLAIARVVARVHHMGREQQTSSNLTLALALIALTLIALTLI